MKVRTLTVKHQPTPAYRKASGTFTGQHRIYNGEDYMQIERWCRNNQREMAWLITPPGMVDLMKDHTPRKEDAA